MAAAIIAITLGGILVYSSIKGVGITQVIGGTAKGDTIDPHGGTLGNSSNVIPSGVAAPWQAPAGSASSFKGPNAELLNYLASAAVSQFHLTITATDKGSHVPNSLHYQGRAFDAAGAEADMQAYDKWVAAQYGKKLLQLIHNPGPVNIYHGQEVNGALVYAGVWSGHKDHVHTGA